MSENWLTNDLDELCAAIWRAMEDGAKNAKSPLHTPVFASVTPAGKPSARVVVLRECASAARRLRCHTDARSRKAPELAQTLNDEISRVFCPQLRESRGEKLFEFNGFEPPGDRVVNLFRLWTKIQIFSTTV